MSTPSADDSGMDLSEFFPIFFEEAGENLERMEQQLLGMDVTSVDDETLNSVFRCAHSVKGGAATFGFADVAELTHQMETLLDRLRRHELTPTTDMVDALLAGSDALRAQIAFHQAGGGGQAVDTRAVRERIGALVHASPAPAAAAPPAAAPDAAPAPAPAATAAPALRQVDLLLGPFGPGHQADVLAAQLAAIADLGRVSSAPVQPGDGPLTRYTLETMLDDDALVEALSFHLSREQVRVLGRGVAAPAPAEISPAAAQVSPAAAALAADPAGAPAPAPAAPSGEGTSFGFFEGAPGSPASAAAAPVAPPEKTGELPTEPAPASAGTGRANPSNPANPANPSNPSNPAPARAAAAPAGGEGTTLRVSVEKVDQLINLVGELVITQAMLAQNSARVDPALYEQLAAGLADLERNTRNLQESVMSIRMIPMSVVFSRFPRMLRDLAAKLGKKVDFVTHGEATELDKGLVEKITDPLTHLVRNACDHGIELPAERLARGKRETGTLTLTAAHEGGSIVIEVRDDGRGLSRDKLLKKARERGIEAPDSLPDAEVWQLIFAPGFSTAEAVTDVSGRGVGMDVVKKNIVALGGSVELESAEGYGMSVKVRLPLTLAIMDSMSVGVGDACYILPLSSVVESLQFTPDRIRTLGGGARVLHVREEYLPVVELAEVFEVPRSGDGPRGGIMVVVESGGVRVALQVDELLGQQQVVVKNLETNYRKVDNVSGATIMGDGQVALIVDVDALVRRSRH